MLTQFEELRAVPILDVARKLGMEFRGTRMHCFNPTHEDKKTASLHFNIKGNYFNCFGCGIGGSPIDLVMAWSGCSMKDAMLWLSQEFGLSRYTGHGLRLRPQGRKRGATLKERQAAPQRRPDPEVYSWLMAKAQLPREASEYLIKRGISAETINDFRLGGALNPKDLIHTAEKLFGRDRLYHAGLLTEGRTPGRLLPVWWEPILLIPFFWKDSSPIYLQARRLTTEDRRKYVGLSGVAKPLFNAQIINVLGIGSEVYVVEGAMDVMAAHEVGLSAIGVLGSTTKFKRNWALALRDFQVIIVPDQDAPGHLFKDGVVAAFAGIGKSVQVRYLPPEYNDLTDALDAIKEGKL
jgi:DNA primase